MRRDTHLPNGRATLGGLVHDAAAGANLALTMLPKAMAYAVVAGVPPVYGLYASCAAPALAVAFGSNRLLFTGPVGVMTVLVLGSLHHFAEPFSPPYIELAASLTLMVGVLILLFAAARLAFLVRAIPTPVTEGFIAAAALLIIGTQVGPALGAPPPSARSGIHLPAFLAEAAEAWSRRDVLVPGLFAACIAIALLARRLFPRIPDALVVVALAFAATFAWNLSERGVEMMGALPTGLPPVSAPSLTPLLSGQLWASAALLALVGMTETSSISRFVARRTGQRSDPGREALGQGLANVAVAFVGGYPVCASLSGTSVNLVGGARGPRPIYFFTVLASLPGRRRSRGHPRPGRRLRRGRDAPRVCRGREQRAGEADCGRSGCLWPGVPDRGRGLRQCRREMEAGAAGRTRRALNASRISRLGGVYAGSSGGFLTASPPAEKTAARQPFGWGSGEQSLALWRIHLEVYPYPPYAEIAESAVRRHAIVALHGRGQPNAPIQPAMARPISSGESSWTKWIPATVFSVSAGHPRTRLTSVSLARIAPGSAFRNSLDTLLVPSQSAYSVARRTAVDTAPSPRWRAYAGWRSAGSLQ
jgi:hypothetical protein